MLQKYHTGEVFTEASVNQLLEGVRPLIKMYVKRSLKKSKTKDYFFARKLLN